MVELEESLQFPYTTADAGLTVSVYRPHRLTLISPEFLLNGVAGQAMCELRYLEPIIRDPEGSGNLSTFSPSTDETRRMFQLYACWHPYIKSLSATALSYPILAVAGTRETTIDQFKARWCRHAGEPADWAKGFHVWGLRASDCYQSVSAHPAFDVTYDDVVAERDAALSNLRCVRGSLRNTRIRTLADDSTLLFSEGPYFHSLALNPGFEYLYQDADLITENVQIVSPNRTKPTIGCERAREWRIAGTRANLVKVGVQNGIGRIRWGDGNVIAGRSTPTFGPTAIRSSPFSTPKNLLLPAYLDGGVYHINPRRELVDHDPKFLRCYGPIVQSLSGGEPQVLTLRIHDNCFSNLETVSSVILVLTLKAMVLHSNGGLFAYQERTYNGYHKLSSASSLTFPSKAIKSSGMSDQGNEPANLVTVSNPLQKGVSDMGDVTDPDAKTDYYAQIDVTLASGRTNPFYTLTYELEVHWPN